jgi:hypothetical protein
MFRVLRWLNALTDPSMDALDEKLTARPRRAKLAQYVERVLNAR